MTDMAGDQRDRHGPGHERGRGADGDHAVHADDGGADDPGQQADRHLGPQAVLRRSAWSSTRSGGCWRPLAQGLPLLIVGYSLLEGVGSALMIPPIYILVTVTFPDVKSRARYFGVVSGAGGLGAAAGPLIGGLVTSAISWRASFGLQVLVVAWIIVLARKITDPARPGPRPRFDLTGAVLSAAGLFFVVLGLLQSRTYGFGKSRQDFTIGNTVVIPKGSISPVWLFVAIGALFLLWFFLHVRASEHKGQDVLLPLRLFRNKIANLGLGTQTIQWLILQGSFFTVSVYLQEVKQYNAIQTGLMLTPATIGILAASAAADRFARRHPPSARRTLRRAQAAGDRGTRWRV